MAPTPSIPTKKKGRRGRQQQQQQAYSSLSITDNSSSSTAESGEDDSYPVVEMDGGDQAKTEALHCCYTSSSSNDEPLNGETCRTNQKQHQNSKKSAASLYAFCAALNSGNLGYDLGVSTNAGPLLQKDVHFNLTQGQLELFLGSLNFWSIFGALLSPIVTDRFGRRATFALAAMTFIVGCILTATATQFEVLMLGRCIVGMGVGIGEAIDPMYIAEIAPKEIRGYLVSWAEAGVAAGVVLGFSSSLVLYALQDALWGGDSELQAQQEWRIMLALGAILPLVMLILLAARVIPESPRWLLAKNRDDEARSVLETIYPCDADADAAADDDDDDDDTDSNPIVDTIMKEIQASLALEQAAAQSVGWQAILCRPSPAVRRMLIVGVGMAIIQQAVGIDAIMFYLLFVIQESGIRSQVGQITALVVLGTVKLIFVMVGAKLFDRVGRRPLLLVSLLGCAASLIFVSLMFASGDSHSSKVLIVVGLAFYLAFFSTGLGPGNWVVVSEVFATSIRAKAMSVAILPNRITATIMASTFLSLAHALTWPGFFLVLAGICLISAVFLFVYLPETKGRSLEEMSHYFAEITGDVQFLEIEARLGQNSGQHHSNLEYPSSKDTTELAYKDDENNIDHNHADITDSRRRHRSSNAHAHASTKMAGVVPIVLLTLLGYADVCCALVPSNWNYPTLNSRQQQNHLLVTRSSIILYSSQPTQEVIANNDNSNNMSDDAATLLRTTDQLLQERNPTKAFECLMQLYSIAPFYDGLRQRFASCLTLKIEILEVDLNAALLVDNQIANAVRVDLAQERMGLSALLIDLERYEEAASHLRAIVSVSPLSTTNIDVDTAHQQVYDKACSMLYRTNAALCDWKENAENSNTLKASVSKHQCQQQHTQKSPMNVPPLHPFEALKWPCVSLEHATYIAQQYANRAADCAGIPISPLATTPLTTISSAEGCTEDTHQSVTIDVSSVRKQQSSTFKWEPTKRIRIGYLSPDFTANHPLTFLMADMFRFHDRARWEVFMYSMAIESEDDRSNPHVQVMCEGADHWVQLNQKDHRQLEPRQLAQRIQADKLDIMIDLCGHSGTSTIMEIMAHRVAPVQASYMGFPGSTGASDFIDYNICDATVVPYQQPQIRRHYLERLLLLPDCYFVNSHAYAVQRELEMRSAKEASSEIGVSRTRYGLPEEAYVLCCHSRPDKIDPATFRSWCRVLSRLQSEAHEALSRPPTVLWLLRSGLEMENNLRKLAEDEFSLHQDSIIMADIAPRGEHLQRLALADLFLDTPAYNAHTVGCDALFAGVPMVTLLRPIPDSEDSPARLSSEWVSTEKWASRVGASLLKAAGLPDLIAPDMDSYEALLYKAATDASWSESIKYRLQNTIGDCPLFDTARWVRNLEIGLAEAVSRSKEGKMPIDIALVDSEDNNN